MLFVSILGCWDLVCLVFSAAGIPIIPVNLVNCVNCSSCRFTFCGVVLVMILGADARESAKFGQLRECGIYRGL